MLSTLYFRRELIKDNPRFEEAIQEHYYINETIYKSHPLFYKAILQETRFNTVLAMCCLFFGKKINSITEIKELFSKYKVASPNSVTSIIAILLATGRIKAWRSIDDRRKTIIEPTDKGLNELEKYMSGALLPLRTLYPNINIDINLIHNKNLRVAFFQCSSSYFFRGLTLINIMPEIGLFICKDGGRMIMLYFYLEAMKNKKSQEQEIVIQYKPQLLASKFYISRMHVTRIISAAQEVGYFTIEGGGFLKINPEFIELVKNYAGLYFAFTSHFMNLHLDNRA